MSNPNYLKNLESQIHNLKEQGKDLLSRIKKMDQPLAHGMLSAEFPSILESAGLGEKLAANAYSNTKSVTDLKKPDGLMASYLFARLDRSSELEITSDSLDGLDAISRYVKLNPVNENRLRESFRIYLEKRKPEGFPVLLIYDGQNEIKTKNNNEAYPSELEYENIIPNSKLKIIMVPQKRIKETQDLLREKGLEIEVLPVEILEVLEINK